MPTRCLRTWVVGAQRPRKMAQVEDTHREAIRLRLPRGLVVSHTQPVIPKAATDNYKGLTLRWLLRLSEMDSYHLMVNRRPVCLQDRRSRRSITVPIRFQRVRWGSSWPHRDKPVLIRYCRPHRPPRLCTRPMVRD